MVLKSIIYTIQVNNTLSYHSFLLFVECKGVVNRLLTDLVQLNPSLFQKESADAVSLLVAEGGVGGGGESKMSPVFLKWDALISFLECWVLGLCQKDTLLEV